MDPYKIMGISRESVELEIKRRFRKLVNQHHPDKGGDPARFTEIKESYDILSDPRRRAHYDKTGETRRPGNDIVSRAANHLVQTFDGVMTKVPINKIKHTNIISHIRTELGSQIAKHRNERKNLVAQIRVSLVLKKRLHQDKDAQAPPYLINHIDEKWKQFINALRNQNLQIKVIEKAADLLDHYKFDHEPEVVVMSYTNSYTATTGY